LDKTLHKQLHEWRVAAKKLKQITGSSTSAEDNSHSSEPAYYEDASVSEGATDEESSEGQEEFDPEQFPFFAPRIQTAVEIASAVAYCHRHRILYRDLKPANIGYSFEEDRIKIFDFGLAIELPASNDPNKTFKLPGNTGTAR
jgi:Protein kinase domain